MSQLSYTALVDGDQPLASGFNSRFLLAINLINSGLESDNLASSSVTAAKIGSGAVTTTKLSHPVLFVQGSNIASATTTDLSTATGNCVDITGTTTITGFGTVQAGTIMFLRFTGALTLTHNATSLILPNNGSNITTAANDCMIIKSLGSGNWICIDYTSASGDVYVPTASNALSGSIVQSVNTPFSAVATGTTAIPIDDTVPQNTEGTEFMTRAITPKSASNFLRIDVVCALSVANDTAMTAALFQDSTASALATGYAYGGVTATNQKAMVCFTHWMTAGTTSSTTFKVRAGADTGGLTITFNGGASARLFGGTMASSMTITEYKA